MSLTLRLTRRASSEIERAAEWWRANRHAAPSALRDDLRGAFELLLRQPAVGTRVESAFLNDVRRLYLGRVRYFVYYRTRNSELVILRFWHARRADPRV